MPGLPSVAMMVVENDTRGWIMACVSGVACMVGASIICVDYLVRLIPGKRNFKIQDSNAFLAASLSLSFGVMLFSALYSMLPSANKYLQRGGYSPSIAAYILIFSFLAGVVGIQVISRFLHHYIPSHVVDCDHVHESSESPGHSHHANANQGPPPSMNGAGRHLHLNMPVDESSPLLQPNDHSPSLLRTPELVITPTSPIFSKAALRRPSLQSRLTSRVSSIVTGSKESCEEEDGPCYGYSDPCGNECHKHFVPKYLDGARMVTEYIHRRPGLLRRATSPLHQHSNASELEDVDENAIFASPTSTVFVGSNHSPNLPPTPDHLNIHSNPSRPHFEDGVGDVETAMKPGHYETGSYHHHHVPENAFLSIGLQTSIAIALHKLPEGFITFATNHANPSLGFAVFMALFIHNITEGFALALPLYLALGSRWKSMIWSSLLGGASQPLGAGIAAIWFKLAGKSDMTPGEGVYGVMFAITSGIMTSVALQLFTEGIGLHHNRLLCVSFAFLGMGILGFSFALTAG